MIKVKRDGARKVRIVVEMAASAANPRSRIPEHPVLPRPLGPASDALQIMRGEDSVEMATADLSGAFCHVFVAQAN